MWAIKDPATAGLHALRGRVDVADIEVIEPEWNRLCRKFSEHAADRLPTSGEPLIRVRRTGFGVRFMPAKNLSVESKRLLQVGGEQLMPAHAPRFVQIGGRLLDGLQPPAQPKTFPLSGRGDWKGAGGV